MKLKPKAIQLLLRVKAHILEEPRRLNMSEWKQTAFPGMIVKDGYEHGLNASKHHQLLTAKTAPPCGTVGCIAGWVCLLSGADYPIFGGQAAAYLGVEEHHLEPLFYPRKWPNKTRFRQYLNARSQRRRAQIVGRVIDEFIAAHS